MPEAVSQDIAAKGRGKDSQSAPGKANDWPRAISNHLAYALLVYTGLHIFVTMTAIKAGKGVIMPYLALVVLVAAIIPACRFIEKRWEDFGTKAASDPALAGIYRRDTILIWLGAFGLPLLVTGLCKAVSTIF